MDSTQLEAVSLVAMLASLPLVSWGTTSDVPFATAVGAALLVLGLATLTALRYLNLEEDQ